MLLVNGMPPDLALVLDGLERPLELVLGGRLAALTLPGQNPPRFGELRRPDHVHADQVDRIVLGGQTTHDQLALLVRVGRELLVDDLVLAVGLLVAVGNGRVIGTTWLVEDVPVDRGRAGAAAVAAAPGGDGCRKHAEGNPRPRAAVPSDSSP